MKLTTIFLTALAATEGLCYPGMGNTITEVARAADKQSGSLSTELLGDLVGLPDKKLSKTGREVKAVLTGKLSAETDERRLLRLPVSSRLCKADTCCVWQHIAADMEAMFRGRSGRCTELARQAIRIGFHDAGTWSKASADGGADGSLILSDELTRFENAGMADMVAKHRELYAKYRTRLGYDAVTMADLIQTGATVATAVCPLGPRIRTYVGRRDSAVANPGGRLPSPFASAESLIAMFQDKTISPRGLVALLGAHTTSQQTAINASRSGDPQDSTPGVWDTLYYRETLGVVPAPKRVFMFQSDVNLAKFPETKAVFEDFAAPGPRGQRSWNVDYAREYVRLSLLGVANINSLTDCSKALPPATTSFRNKDQHKLDRWLKSIDWSAASKGVARLLLGGDEINVPEEAIPTSTPKGPASGLRG